MRLHETGVVDGPRGGDLGSGSVSFDLVQFEGDITYHSDATVTFLHDDGQDEARIDASGARDVEDRGLDVCNLCGRVVGYCPVVLAGSLHDWYIVGEALRSDQWPNKGTLKRSIRTECQSQAIDS